MAYRLPLRNGLSLLSIVTMKPTFVMTLVAVAACIGLQLASARDNDAGQDYGSRWGRWIALLPGGEQVKLKAAHALAIQDPAVKAAAEKRKQAEKEYHDLLRATILKIDPSLQSALNTMPEPKKHHRRW